MFDSPTSQALDEITLAYKDVCIGYLAEVGKLGAKNNGLTLRWAGTSPSCRHLRKLIRQLKNVYLERSREEKYYLLREIYALKPGVHERFYPKEHAGRVLSWLRRDFSSNNSIDAKSTLFLKSMIVIENFRDLEPFLEVEGQWCFPSTLKSAQAATKFLLESQNWKSLEELKILDSWMNYAPCSVNEGPCVVRNGRVLFQSLSHLDEIAIGYKKIIDAAATGIRKDG